MGNDNWRTDEPEVGQPLTIYGQDKWSLKIYRGRQNGYFMFEGRDGMDDEEDLPEWQPIATPEERRLRAEVERLREFLQEVFSYIPQNIELARQIRAEFGCAQGDE